MESNTVIVTQARTSSTRLPNKVLMKVNGVELLKIHLERLSKCKSADQIIVATTTDPSDAVLANLVKGWGMQVFRGDMNNVLDRFYQAVKTVNPKWVVRITSDCPLIDPGLIDAVIACAKINDADYCSNGLIENFPDGQDVEVFKFSALKDARENAKLKSEMEHVTPYIINNSSQRGKKLFKSINFPCRDNFSGIRMTVDEKVDFDLIEKLISALGTNETWLNYTNFIIEKELNKINSNIIRNEGLLKSLKND